MGNSMMRRAAAALWLLAIFYTTGAREVHGAEPARFRLVGERLVVVPVLVDGAGPFDFLLDTGTNTTLVTPKLAARLRLRADGNLRLLTVAGERRVPRSRLGEVAVGGRAARELEALVCELGELRAADPRIEGVLGQNFLARFNYSLDYDERRLVFESAGETPAAPSGEGVRVPFESREGRLLLAAQGGGGRESWRLVLDTAATALVLFKDRADKFDAAPRGSMTAATNAGSRAVRVARLRRLRVGGEEFADVPVALIPDPAGAPEREEDGLLPASLFRYLYVNHREGYVVFKK
jgi:predicted aspartyl protease